MFTSFKRGGDSLQTPGRNLQRELNGTRLMIPAVFVAVFAAFWLFFCCFFAIGQESQDQKGYPQRGGIHERRSHFPILRAFYTVVSKRNFQEVPDHGYPLLWNPFWSLPILGISRVWGAQFFVGVLSVPKTLRFENAETLRFLFCGPKNR